MNMEAVYTVSAASTTQISVWEGIKLECLYFLEREWLL